MFMILVSFLFLIFKFNRSVYLLLSLEFLVLGVLFMNIHSSFGFFVLYYMVFGVISSVTGLFLFVLVIKTFGGSMVFL